MKPDLPKAARKKQFLDDIKEALKIVRSLDALVERNGWVPEHTPPKFNIAPEKWWFEDYFPSGTAYFQGLR